MLTINIGTENPFSLFNRQTFSRFFFFWFSCRLFVIIKYNRNHYYHISWPRVFITFCVYFFLFCLVSFVYRINKRRKKKRRNKKSIDEPRWTLNTQKKRNRNEERERRRRSVNFFFFCACSILLEMRWRLYYSKEGKETAMSA